MPNKVRHASKFSKYIYVGPMVMDYFILHTSEIYQIFTGSLFSWGILNEQVYVKSFKSYVNIHHTMSTYSLVLFLIKYQLNKACYYTIGVVTQALIVSLDKDKCASVKFWVLIHSTSD